MNMMWWWWLKGYRDKDLLRLLDLCPFLASEKRSYDDGAVLALLRKNPSAARVRHSYRCGIGSANAVRPLAPAVALGASLEVVRIMVDACPEALRERLSGGRTVLHYAVAEGAGVEVVRYLASRDPSLVAERDSFGAVPLHLASTCPSSSVDVLRHLLRAHPGGARSVDRRSQTPLHRACKSRASLEKVLALVEANPEALRWNDRERNSTPLGWAERMEHRLGDPIPEVVEVLQMLEDILALGTDNANYEGEECQRRARQILGHFGSIEWRGGIRTAFSRNTKLLSLLNLPMVVLPELLALIGGSENIMSGPNLHGDGNSEGEGEDPSLKYKMESIFSVLVQCPDVVPISQKRSTCTNTNQTISVIAGA